MDNLSWGNPLAHRVRVHYNTASKKIYEGMPVCYNYDTTTNWAGGSVSDGAVTASTTLTAGTPETAAAKYLEVEEPNDGNLQWFAGVVARGGWCGKTTSATAGVGLILDIYVPNGAIVPVRAGVACTVAQTVLSVIAATQYLGHALSATEARPVAIVEETVNRSTAGLILAKLDPNIFIYQEQHGSALLVGTGATAAAAGQVVNRIRVDSAQTTGAFCALQVRSKVTAGGYANSTAGGGIAAWFRGECSTSLAASLNTVHISLKLSAGTYTSGVRTPLHVKLDVPAEATLTSGRLCVLNLDSSVSTDSVDGNHYWMYLERNGSDAPNGLFTCGSLLDPPCNVKQGTCAISHVIPFDVNGTDYYIMVTNEA